MKRLKGKSIWIMGTALALLLTSGSSLREAPAAVNADGNEGRVIVCVKESKGGKENRSTTSKDSRLEEESTLGITDKTGAVAEKLLAGAEDLMDVNEGMEEYLIEQDAVDMATEASVNGSNDSKKTLKLVTSDVYDTEELMEKLSALPEVICAEPDVMLHIEEPSKMETDLVYSNASEEEVLGDDDTTGDYTRYQYAYGKDSGGMEVPDWNDPDNKNAEGIVVAVLDTGVDYLHQDLEDIIWDLGDSDEYQSLKDLGGGKYGICTIQENSQGEPYSSDDPMDDHMHGTHCAGNVAASWNGKGVSGAANGAKVMAIKCFHEHGGGYLSAILRAVSYIREAKRCGVNIRVTSNSWALPVEGNFLKASFRALAEDGIVSTFASSNENCDNDYTSSSVSDLYYIPGLIFVNASDSLGKKAGFSNYGLRSADLFAPGAHILSTCPSDLALDDGMDLRLSELLEPGRDDSGREMKTDFESDDYLLIKEEGDELGAVFSREEDPEDPGNHAMKITLDFSRKNAGDGYELFSLTPPLNTRLEAGTGLKLVFRSRGNSDDLVYFLRAKKENGEFVSLNYSYLYRSMNTITCSLPENIDLEDLTIQFYLATDQNEYTDSKVELWLDDFFLSYDEGETSYCYLSGTSMATPTAAGEAAIIAAAFPEDDAAKCEARILGSVRRAEELEGFCVTGGLANVKNALAKDYMPVIAGMSENETGELAVSGYFFGEKESTFVTLSQDGKKYTCSANELINDPDDPDAGIILIDSPDELKSGEVFVTVTNTLKEEGRRSGSRFVSLSLTGDPQAFYERLSLPEDDIFSNMLFINSAMLNDEIFLTGFDMSMDHFDIRTARIRDGFITWMDDIVPGGYEGCNLCVFDGKLWYFDEGDICAFDPEDDNEYRYPASNYPDFTQGIYTDLFYTGKELLCFNTPKDMPTEVWEFDPYLCDMKKIIDLKAGYGVRNLYGLRETENGREIYVGLGRLPEESKKTVMEKIIIDGKTGEARREYVSKDLLPEDFTEPKNSNAFFDGPYYGFNGVGSKNGIYLAGGYILSENENRIEQDNWYFDFEHPENGFIPGEKRLSAFTIYDVLTFSGQGKVYFFGDSADTPEDFLLSCIEDETWDYGNKPALPQAEPEKEIEYLKDTGELVLSMKVGERTKLSCEAVYPEGMKAEDRPPLLFASENEEVVKVHPLTGDIRAFAPGNTVITASCGDKTVSWKIRVIKEDDPSKHDKDPEGSLSENDIPGRSVVQTLSANTITFDSVQDGDTLYMLKGGKYFYEDGLVITPDVNKALKQITKKHSLKVNKSSKLTIKKADAVKTVNMKAVTIKKKTVKTGIGAIKITLADLFSGAEELMPDTADGKYQVLIKKDKNSVIKWESAPATNAGYLSLSDIPVNLTEQSGSATISATFGGKEFKAKVKYSGR